MTKKTLNLTRGLEVKGKYSNIDFLYGPYKNIQDACKRINKNIREKGLTIGIESNKNNPIIEYWWRDGIEDEQLVRKVPEIKIKVNEEIISSDKNGLVDLGNLDVLQADTHLSENYQMSELTDEDLKLLPGDSFENSFSKVEKEIHDNKININEVQNTTLTKDLSKSTVKIEGHETPLGINQESYLQNEINKNRVLNFEGLGKVMQDLKNHTTNTIPDKPELLITLDNLVNNKSSKSKDYVPNLQGLTFLAESILNKLKISENYNNLEIENPEISTEDSLELAIVKLNNKIQNLTGEYYPN